jgi:hypothetical protein
MSEDKKRKKVFFPFFMFVSVGFGFLLIERLGAIAVVALMFVGLGLGLLFDSTVTVKERKVSVELPVKAGGIIYCVIGGIFIVSGLLTMISPRLLVDYVTYLMGLAFIVLGAYLLVSGFKLIEATSKHE